MLRALLLLLLSPAALLAADPAAVRRIEADVSQPAHPLNRMYNLCVGAGRANEGLRADWQRQLQQVRADCGFRYIRFHGLFCDDMGVYREDAQGRAIYNWQYIDELFDFLQRIGIKPFVELGFMPSALASGPHTIFWYKANVTPPKDYAKWEAFVAAFVRHVTERYGADEVRRWYFEVWNEPNLTGFWMGTTQGKTEAEFAPIARAEYLKLYAASARAVKSVDSTYRVGGPATAGSGWIDETLAACAERQLPLDFVSTHTYATSSGYLDEHGNAGTVFSPDRNAVTDEVKGVRQKIARSAFPGAELHYTEWSSSYTPADPLHDSYHSAAFILDKVRHIGAAADSMSYWTFTDIFEEAGPRMTPFHGGFGLLNYQDLMKPSYFAYAWLNRLGDHEIAASDSDAFICRNDAGAVQALFWDFTITHPGASVINQEFYLADQPAKAKGTVELNLRGLAPGRYQLTARKVGYRANDVQSAWRDLGSPAQLTRAQVRQLRAASSGEPFVQESVTVAADGHFSRPFAMRENDVWLVELSPAPAKSTRATASP
ncbi:glycoside hydrolase [Opitutus sp. ER46]|uniref:GH39 family glycosyl hydrolase n=1 Tax=Opitutus sp. ER46 TaxID=2161864 RepID=UPI000D320AEA|nr:glycoside hydrolase [Opitutus sp. ER46]PTX92476.1 glycoside hydrolase [Opitutus sp. ER46]